MGHDTVPYVLYLQHFVILLLNVSPFLKFKFFLWTLSISELRVLSEMMSGEKMCGFALSK